MFSMSDLGGCLASPDKCKDCNDFCQQACDLISSLVLNCDTPQEKGRCDIPHIPHACASCLQSFSSDVQLREHVRREHKESLNLVPLDTLYELLGLRIEASTPASHEIHPKKRRRHACTSCKKRYKCKYKLARHARRAHGDKVNGSPAKTKGSHKSRGSRKEHSSNKPPKEDIHQERKFVHTNGSTRRSDGNSRGEVSSAQVSYLCEVCGGIGTFSKKSSRLGSKSCTCGTVSKPREDAQHAALHSTPERKPKKSSSGDKTLSKDVTSEYRCTVCNKLYKDKRGLAIHMAWERKAMRKTGKKIQTAVNGRCQSGDKFRGFLWAHQEEVEVAAGRKTHKCRECDKSFDSSRAVLVHFRHMHEDQDSEPSYESDDGLYHCRRCKVTCLTKDDMQLHGVQHRKCTRCDKIFSSVATLKSHVRRMHWCKRGDGVCLYSCSGCSASFRSKKTLQLHCAVTKHSAGRSINRIVGRRHCDTEMSQDIWAGAEDLQRLADDNSLSESKQEEDSSTADYANVDCKAWYW